MPRPLLAPICGAALCSGQLNAAFHVSVPAQAAPFGQAATIFRLEMFVRMAQKMLLIGLDF